MPLCLKQLPESPLLADSTHCCVTDFPLQSPFRTLATSSSSPCVPTTLPPTCLLLVFGAKVWLPQQCHPKGHVLISVFGAKPELLALEHKVVVLSRSASYQGRRCVCDLPLVRYPTKQLAGIHGRLRRAVHEAHPRGASVPHLNLVCRDLPAWKTYTSLKEHCHHDRSGTGHGPTPTVTS